MPRILCKASTVAKLFKVDPKTATRWIAAGRFEYAVKTPGGHWRVDLNEVYDILEKAAE